MEIPAKPKQIQTQIKEIIMYNQVKDDAIEQDNRPSKENAFLRWAYGTRANTIKRMASGEEISHDKMFLSFTSHNPVFISNGPAGLNGAVKGVGFVPKDEYIQEYLDKFTEHVKTYKEGDKEYSMRGLQLLLELMYSEEAEKKLDFNYLHGIEMAFTHTYDNYKADPTATLLFYQPPAISFELRGQMEIVGEPHAIDADIDEEKLHILQRLVNAQHDCYHLPNMKRWKTRPVYRFRIEEIWNKSVGKEGFGKRIK